MSDDENIAIRRSLRRSLGIRGTDETREKWKAEQNRVDIEHKLRQQEVEERDIRLEIMHKLKNIPAKKYFWFLVCYLLIVLLIMLISGFQYTGDKFIYKLSPYVVGILSFISTATFLTPLTVFLTWLFRTRPKGENKYQLSLSKSPTRDN